MTSDTTYLTSLTRDETLVLLKLYARLHLANQLSPRLHGGRTRRTNEKQWSYFEILKGTQEALYSVFKIALSSKVKTPV